MLNIQGIYIYYWLVVWNSHLITFHILGISSSQLTIRHIFQRGRSATKQFLDLSIIYGCFSNYI